MNYTERVARRLLTARESPDDSSIDCTQDGKPWMVTAEDCRVLAKAYLDGLRPEVAPVIVEVFKCQDGRVFCNVNQDGKQLAHLKAGQSYEIKTGGNG